MKDVDPVKTQPRQTAFERCPDGLTMRPNSLDGTRTLVPTTTLAGFSFCRTRPRFFSDSPSPYCTAVSK